MSADCPKCGSKAFVEVGIPRTKVCATCGFVPSIETSKQRERVLDITADYLRDVEDDLRAKVRQAVESVPKLARMPRSGSGPLIDLLLALDTFLQAAESPGGEEAVLALGRLQQAWVRAGGTLPGGSDA